LNQDAVQTAVKQAETTLNGEGRVLLRASGTEPKIRVMVEGLNQGLVQAQAEQLAAVIRQLAT
jgi:phosphoglucosamine mutase